MVAKRTIQGFCRGAKETGQSVYGYLTTRRALIDLGFACRNGLCIGFTPGISTLSALGLRKPAVNLFEFQSLKFKGEEGAQPEYQHYNSLVFFKLFTLQL